MVEYRIADILATSEYGLNIFTQDEIDKIVLFEYRNNPYLECFATGKKRPAKPEEIVRQLYLLKLIHEYGYPPARIEVEKAVWFGSTTSKKRADIVVSDKDDPTTAYIIVEVKKPKRKDGLEQLKSYCNAEGAPIAIWTNGTSVEILHREDPNLYRSISHLPNIHQTLAEVINERVTLAELIQRNRLVTEKLTLRSIIESLEDLVLANAGVDAFDEVFKLIYAKLYDEAQAVRRRGNFVEFRAAGETHTDLKKKINRLFEEAKRKWPGVFLEGEGIDLSPAHLAVCVSFLQDIKLFNSTLQIIDEAFEYLVTQVSKGEKGQYFTPRNVIDMCVKMLNPKSHEYVIDTAAGSCGYTVHTIFHVWQNEFRQGGKLRVEAPTREEADYASEMVYGLDFDPRSIKIAKALNLIAGDGKTNVYRVNTLDPRSWSDEAKANLKHRLRAFSGDDSRETNRWNRENYRLFDFDVVMTNPPFAGDIKDTRILHQYEVAKKDNGKWHNKVGRDILFIERNLEFLRAGGRIAIVLPQGRLNNISNEPIRHFLAEHCRILGVIGLDNNTFKPHTGTKTSVLLLQKWNDDPNQGAYCPRVDDYPIFFATSMKSGKDNSGLPVFIKDDDGEPRLDEHGHFILDDDLTEIAQAFILFAKEQKCPFWEGEEIPF